MERATGLGGVFFKAKEPEKLTAWYEKHLGLKRDTDGGGVVFKWRYAQDPGRTGMTVWAPFPADTDYFDPSRSSFMLNYRVEDLDAVLEGLRAEGVEVDPKREDYDYGRFAWIMDPEGHRIELWQPLPAAKPRAADVARGLVDRINAGDAPGINALMTDDGRFIDAMGVVHGGEEMRGGWAEYLGVFPDYRIEVEEMVTSEETVAIFGWASGSFRGRGQSPEGRAWRFPSAWKAVVRGARILEWRVYADIEPMMRSSGIRRFD